MERSSPFLEGTPLEGETPLALLTWRAPKTMRPIDLPWTGFLLRLILFGEKNCPVGRFLTPALCTASHRVLRPWGLILMESRLPGGAFLRIKASDFFGRNLGFSPNGGLRGRNPMRSGAKGGGQGWTVLFGALPSVVAPLFEGSFVVLEHCLSVAAKVWVLGLH